MKGVLSYPISQINGGSKFSSTISSLHKNGGSVWSAIKDRGGVPKMLGGMSDKTIDDLTVLVHGKSREILIDCIDKMCKGMVRELGDDVNLDNMTTREKVNTLLSKLPGKDFTINEDMASVLKVVGEKLNESFNFSINVDTNDKRILMIDIINTLSSLVMGLNTDVAVAYGAIKGTATNLMDHASILDKLVEYLKITLNNDAEIKNKPVIEGIIKTIEDRSKSISTYSKNLMDGILTQLSKAETEFKLSNLEDVQRVVARLNGKSYMKDDEIDKYKTEIINAFGETAYYAYVVNDALKRAEMSVNDLKINDMTEKAVTEKLKNIREQMVKNLVDNPTKAGEISEAFNKILNNIGKDNYPKIVSLIEGMKMDSVSGGSKLHNSNNILGGHSSDIYGGADVEYETPVGRRVRKQIKNKVALMKAFNLVIGKAFDSIVKEIEFAKDLGYSTPITEDLIDFSENMDNLSDFRVPDVYMALIGFDKSSVGESTYNNYMRSVDNVIASIKKLSSNSTYSSIHMKLNSVSEHLEKFKSDVDKFRSGMSTISNTFDGNVEKSGGTNSFDKVLPNYPNFDEEFSELSLYQSFGNLPSISKREQDKISSIVNEIEYTFNKNNSSYDFQKAVDNYKSKSIEKKLRNEMKNTDLLNTQNALAELLLLSRKVLGSNVSDYKKIYDKTIYDNISEYCINSIYFIKNNKLSETDKQSLSDFTKILFRPKGDSETIDLIESITNKIHVTTNSELMDNINSINEEMQKFIKTPKDKEIYANIYKLLVCMFIIITVLFDQKGILYLLDGRFYPSDEFKKVFIDDYDEETVDNLFNNNYEKINVLDFDSPESSHKEAFNLLEEFAPSEYQSLDEELKSSINESKSSVNELKLSESKLDTSTKLIGDNLKDQLKNIEIFLISELDNTLVIRVLSFLKFIEYLLIEYKVNCFTLLFKNDLPCNRDTFEKLPMFYFYEVNLAPSQISYETIVLFNILTSTSNICDISLNYYLRTIEGSLRQTPDDKEIDIIDFRRNHIDFGEIYSNSYPFNNKYKIYGIILQILSNSATFTSSNELTKVLIEIKNQRSYEFSSKLVEQLIDKTLNIQSHVPPEEIYTAIVAHISIMMIKYANKVFSNESEFFDTLIRLNKNGVVYFPDIKSDDIKTSINLIIGELKKCNKKGGANYNNLLKSISGGVDNSYDLLREALPENSKYTVKISERLKSLKYYIRVAAIKENIKNVQGELEKDTEHYNNMTSEMIAEKIKQLNNLKDASVGTLANLYPGDNDKIKSMTKFYNDEYQVKRNLLEAAQALDSQLKLVTENIVKNPETIQEIKNMITDSDIISYWYDESTGNKLCELFEKFNYNNSNLSIGTTEHYYNSIIFTGKISMRQLMSEFLNGDKSLLVEDFYKNIYYNFMSLSKNYISSDDFATCLRYVNRNSNRSTIPYFLTLNVYGAPRNQVLPINIYQISNNPILKSLTFGFGNRYFNIFNNIGLPVGNLTDLFLINTAQNFGDLDDELYFIKYNNYDIFPFCNMFRYSIIPAVTKAMSIAGVNINISEAELVKKFLAGFSVFLSLFMLFPDIHSVGGNLSAFLDSNSAITLGDGNANSLHEAVVTFLTDISAPQQPAFNAIVIPGSYTAALAAKQATIAAGFMNGFNYNIMYRYLFEEMREFLAFNGSSYDSIIKTFYIKMVNVMSRYMARASVQFFENSEAILNNNGFITLGEYRTLLSIVPKNNTPVINSIPIIAYEALKNTLAWVPKDDADCQLPINNLIKTLAGYQNVNANNLTFKAQGGPYINKLASFFNNNINDLTLSSMVNLQTNKPNFNSIKFFNKMKTTVGNFVDPISVETYPDLFKTVKGVFSSQAMLKNIIEIFLKIGGYKETSNSMHPKLLYSRLLDYCIRSSIDLLPAQQLAPGQILANVAGNNVMGNNQVGAFLNYPVVNPEGIILTTASRRSQYNRFNDSFEGEDEIFELMMKSIVAKIFTILGVSDLFERPVGTTKPTALRLLIGGGEQDETSSIYASGSINGGSEIPIIHDDIADLYVKLLLYLEFYKDIFRPENIPNNSMDISMIPDINNMFTKVIDIVFTRNNGNETGHYSVEDIREFVRSVNDIYDKHKDSNKNAEQVTKLIISNLVNEVNRRYGILTDSDARDYNNDKYLLYQMSDPTGSNKTRGYDAALLPDEDLDDSQIGFNAPSNKYLPDNLRDLNKTVYKLNEVRLDDQLVPNSRRYIPNTWRARVQALDRFRISLSNYFNNSGYNLNDDIDISDKVRSLTHIKRDLANAKTPQDRFNVIAQTMLGDDFTTTSNQIRYIMFHELVVTNLTILKKIYSILSGFRLSLLKMKDIDANITVFRTNLANIINNPYPGGVNANQIYNNASAGVNYLNKQQYLQSLLIQANGNQFTNPDVYLPNISFLAQVRANLNIDELMQRMPNYSDNFVKLVNYCSLISCEFQGLVKCNVSNSRINISFGTLSQKVIDLFSETKRYVDMFSGIIPKKVVETFEDRKRPGSLYWLNTHLIDDLIKGVKYNVGGPGNKSITVNQMSSMVSNISKALIGELKNNKRNNLGDALVKLTYFNPIKSMFNNSFYYNDLEPEASILKSTASSLNYSTNSRVSALYSFGDGVNAPVIGSDQINLTNKSLVCHFNDTIAKFLKVNTDSTNYKIYKPLVNDLINTTFSEQILGTKRICDGLFDIQSYMLSEINKVKVTGSRDNGIDIFKSICQSIGVDAINFIPDLVHNELGNRWGNLAIFIRNVVIPGGGLAGGFPVLGLPATVAGNVAPGAGGIANTFPLGVAAVQTRITPNIVLANNPVDNMATVNGTFLNSLAVQIDGIVNSYIFPKNGQLIFQDSLLNIWKNTITQLKNGIAVTRNRNAAQFLNDVSSDPGYHNIQVPRERFINMFKYADELCNANYVNLFRNIGPLNGAGPTVQVQAYGAAPAAGNGVAALTTLIFNALVDIVNRDPYIIPIATRLNNNLAAGVVYAMNADVFNGPINTALETEYFRARSFITYVTGLAPPNRTWKHVFSLIEILSTLFHVSPNLAHFSYMVLGLFPDDPHSSFGFVTLKSLEANNISRIGTKIVTCVSGSMNPKAAVPAFDGANMYHESLTNNISIFIAIKLALLLKCKLPFDYPNYPRSLHEFIGNFINGDDVIRGFFTLRSPAPLAINLFDAYNESSMFIATVEHLTAYLETLAPSDPTSILSYTANEYKRSVVAVKVQFRFELIKHIQVDELAPFIFGISETNYKSVKKDKLAKFARHAKSVGSINNSNMAMELTIPSEGCGLFLSLSEVMKQYVTERDYKDVNKYKYMADSISELTTTTQEIMSTSLPYFEKMFTALTKRAELIKNIAQISGLQVLVALPINIDEDIVINGKTYFKVMPSYGMPYKEPLFNTGGDINIKNNIIAACDDVINGSIELIKSINGVVGELSFKPEFFEFRNGFVGNYQNINNKLPFMPISQLTHSLKPVFVDILSGNNNPNGNILLPPSDIDNNIYKYIHGCRYLMTKYNIPFSMEKMQSVRDLFSKLISNSSLMITEESFKKSLDNTLSLLRFASDVSNNNLLSYSSVFEEIVYFDLWTNQKSVSNIEPVNTYQALDNPARYGPQLNRYKQIIENDIGANVFANATNYLIVNSNNLPANYTPSANTTTEAVINVANNNNQSTEFDNIKNIITNVVNQDHNRKWLIVQNILEVNIIPINIHMLQRDIPLIYLLNYSYTFDHMVQEFTRNYDNNRRMGIGAINDRSDQIYTKLLLNPYGFMDYHVYTKSYSALVRGQTSIGFGRLKFISDQLFNKCLLNTLYYRNPNNDEYDIPAQRAQNGLMNRFTDTYTDLYYPDPNNQGAWASIVVSRYIIYIGYQRFHSKIVRHLHFLTLLQHLILHKLGKELEDHDDIVIKSYPIVDPTVTQFRGEEMWTEDSHKMSSYDRKPNRRVVPFSIIN